MHAPDVDETDGIEESGRDMPSPFNKPVTQPISVELDNKKSYQEYKARRHARRATEASASLDETQKAAEVDMDVVYAHSGNSGPTRTSRTSAFDEDDEVVFLGASIPRKGNSSNSSGKHRQTLAFESPDEFQPRAPFRSKRKRIVSSNASGDDEQADHD
ncbi:hypothetical protein QFC22_005302 [Naganishia vaughanmartiniae]|uniref:Uncharacterized protein n=1 Tax=Naganishia vaughanmartiniae TaxID=1424756 RepID=A0ACC2WUY7_9TREE|nr:hypothetical protein QFC22_005302 [Naganishia vaughanmartiniae]